MDNQRRQVARDGVPNHIQIHVVIVVDENVSHGREQPPRNFWKAVARFGRQAAGGLANDLELAVHRLVFFLVRLESLQGNSAGETLDRLGGYQNVLQVGVILPHKLGSRW